MPPDLIDDKSTLVQVMACCIALKFDRYLDSAAAEVCVKFPNDWKSLKSNLADLAVSLLVNRPWLIVYWFCFVAVLIVGVDSMSAEQSSMCPNSKEITLLLDQKIHKKAQTVGIF